MTPPIDIHVASDEYELHPLAHELRADFMERCAVVAERLGTGIEYCARTYAREARLLPGEGMGMSIVPDSFGRIPKRCSPPVTLHTSPHRLRLAARDAFDGGITLSCQEFAPCKVDTTWGVMACLP